MDSFLDKFIGKIEPIATKLNANKYLGAIRDAFMGVMSLLILGSIFLLFTNIPIPGYSEFMANIFGENWNTFLNIPYEVTMNIMTLFIIIGIARSLARSNEVDDATAVLWSIVGFLILTPISTFEVNGNMSAFIPMGNFSASGLFLGMISAIGAVQVMTTVLKKGWKISMPESVPSNVTRSFDALIPGLFVIITFMLVRLVFSLTAFATAQEFIFKIIQTPLTALGTSLPATILVMIIETVLFGFGLHGPNIMLGVMQPLWFATMAENLSAYQAHLPLPNIVTYQFYANVVKVGGTGATLGLAILCLFFAHSKRLKTLGKLAFGPSLFNINEPLIFGMPIVLNPILIIPFVFITVLLTVLSYFVMSIGWVPPTNGVNIPWSTPPIISGFLACGWRGAIWQIIEIGISVAVYFPFFRSEDRKALLLEQAEVSE